MSFTKTIFAENYFNPENSMAKNFQFTSIVLFTILFLRHSTVTCTHHIHHTKNGQLNNYSWSNSSGLSLDDNQKNLNKVRNKQIF